jgi:hypothetical protein
MMQAFRVETTIAPNGSLTIKHLPLPAGEAVEVIILLPERKPDPKSRYPLRGTKVEYRHPYEPVAQDDWEDLQ